MDRLARLALLCLLLAVPSAAEARPTLLARGKIAAGASMGLDWPLAQEDAGLGPVFAAFGRYGLNSRFALEPTLSFSLPSDGSTPSGAKVDAPQFRCLALDFLARSHAFGFALTANLGFGACDLSLPGDSDAGLRFLSVLGAGVEFGFGPITARCGPRLLIVDNEGGTRKNLELRLGALYHFN